MARNVVNFFFNRFYHFNKKILFFLSKKTQTHLCCWKPWKQKENFFYWNIKSKITFLFKFTLHLPVYKIDCVIHLSKQVLIQLSIRLVRLTWTGQSGIKSYWSNRLQYWSWIFFPLLFYFRVNWKVIRNCILQSSWLHLLIESWNSFAKCW